MFRTSQLFAHLDHPSHLRDDDGVSDDQELLTLAELCTSYNIPRPGPIQIGTGSHPHEDSFPFYTPNFPRSKRLLRLAYPTGDGRLGSSLNLIERAGGSLEEVTRLDEEDNAGVADRAVVPKLKRLTHLGYNFKSYRLLRKIPSYVFSLPSTLHQIILVTEVVIPHAYKIVHHLATSSDTRFVQ
ncbi:hypothetical protein JCM5353_005928 [Sporobolomyces roseus]